ncbi:MAG: hypothetical protein Q9219_003403 [cf. Caloplaca sp. 3 TL-2023]
MIFRKFAVVVSAGLCALVTGFSSYEPPTAVQHHDGHYFRRQDQCLSSQHFCPGANGDSGCCGTDAQCAIDDGGRIACCPSNAVCTGQLGQTPATATAAGLQPTPTTQALGTTSPTTPTATATVTNGGSRVVANIYYPYHYLPTTYPNADLCTSAFSSCRSEFASCTSSLETGGNGVTVSGAGGGITAQPALGAASAGSICSSLSTKACYNLGLGNCPMYGTAAATGGGGTFAAGNAAPTKCMGPYRALAAVVVGMAGQAIH